MRASNLVIRLSTADSLILKEIPLLSSGADKLCNAIIVFYDFTISAITLINCVYSLR